MIMCCAVLVLSSAAQTIRKVEILSPAIGNASNNEVAVVNSTGFVYTAGQAFGNNFGVIDPNTNQLIKVIRPADLNSPTIISFSRVNQTTNIVYFLYATTPNAQIVSIDGRPSSSTFNQLLPPMVFNNQTLAAFAIDQTRNLLYASTRTTGSNPVQSQIQIVDINPGNATFHQILSTVALPAGQQIGHLAVNSVTNKIYIASQLGGGGVFVLNGATNALTKIASTVQTTVIAVNEVSNTIYAGLNGQFGDGTSYIQAIDGATDTFTRNINTPGAVVGNFGELIAVNSASERIYAILNNNILTVIDGKRTSPTFNTVLSNISGEFSGELAIDEGLNKIVVTSNGFKTSIIDGATNTVAATTQGNTTSVDVAINPITHRAYVGYVFYTTQAINLNDNSYTNIETTFELGELIVNPNNNSVYLPRNGAVSDIGFLNSNDVTGTVSGTPHNFGRFLFPAQNTLTNRIYVVNSAANAAGTSRNPGYVTVIDGATNNTVANVDVGGQPFSSPAVNEATNKIYVMNAGSGTAFPSKIIAIDGATNTTSTVDTSAFPANSVYQTIIVANPVTNRIYFLVNGGPGGVIDGATNVATPLPGLPGFFGILVNPNLNRVYLSTSTGIRVLNGADDSEIANIPITGALAINKTTGRIFVRNTQNQTLTAIDGNSNTVVSTVSLPNGFGAMTVNEAANRLYVTVVTDPNEESTSSVLFVNADTLAIENTLPVPIRASRIVVNPATNTVYVSSLSASQRTGIVIISDPVPCTFTISPTSSTIAVAGVANQQINVSTQNGCAWTAQSNDNWLTVTGGATGNGSGTVTYSAAANSGAQRTGTITVAGQTFTVNQATASTANPYIVTNTNDSGAGSLRQAIIDANATTADDTITFNISGCPNGVCTITLTGGELAINATSTAGKLTITNSTGASNLLISGNNASRVFYVRTGANLTLNGVTVTGGKTTGRGGGLLNDNGTVMITNSIISDSSADSNGSGVFNYLGNFTIINSTLFGNAAQSNGGGIYNDRGSLMITDSSIIYNYVFIGSSSGSGIFSFGGTVTITNSTINDNIAEDAGGGIVANGSRLTVTNSTISGNSAYGTFTAGGIDYTGGNTSNLTNVTITNNRSVNANCTTCGGGIWNSDGGFVVNLRNTIIAGNTVANASSSPDFYGPTSTSSSFNLIGNSQGTTGITNGTNNNQVGTNTSPVDARLAPLGNYGGTTQTHALLSNSPAINAGSDCVINLTCSSNNPPAALTTDQRGAGFPRKVGNAVDIGAIEFVSPNVVNNNGQILFFSNRDGNNEIYKMNPDGSNQQRLTNSPEGEGSGKWSPDNRKILYNKSPNSTTNQIWVMNADGSNQTMISDATGYNVSYGWSSNGQKILFTKGQTNSGGQIWTMNADGSNKVQLTSTNMIDHFPVWSPDDGKIAFGRCDANFVCDIFTINADGSNQTNLTSDNPNDDDSPKWSPDGSKIVFGRETMSGEFGEYNVFVMSADGTNKSALTNDPVQTFSPSAISPNGSSVAMNLRPDRITAEIATVGINGSNLANLTNNSVQDFFGAWSPDSNKIAFTSGNTAATQEIYVMNADGSSVVRLTFNSVRDFVTDWQTIPSYTVSTPAGQNISVTPTSNLNLNFANVTTAGNTVATVIPPDQLQPLPSGFTLFGSNLIYDITTSAVFSGNITVTFAVPNVADAATCSNMRSLHYENGAWTTNTNATPIYNAGAQICTVAQTVTSLSPFVVVLQTPASFSYEADVSPRPNGDGFVDADDIQQIRLFSVGGGLPYQSNEFQRVDCSPRSTLGDGFLDSDDVQQARRYSVGTDSSQLAGGPSSGSAPFRLDSAASAIDETFDSSTLFTNQKSKRSPAFRIGGQINNADQTITVPVLIDTTGKEAGYTFSLSYDAEMLTNPQVTIGNAGGDVVYKANTEGEIGFSVTSFFDETIAPGANQVLVNVTFTVAANTAAGTTAINFTDALARRKASGVDPNTAVTQPTYTGGKITVGRAAGK